MTALNHDYFRDRLAQPLDLTNPLHGARFQQTVYQFMGSVRRNDDPMITALLEQFCDIISQDKAWHIAQIVVPEFRESLSD